MISISIWLLPLLAAVWVLNSWVLLAGLRLLLSQTGGQDGTLCRNLAGLVDPVESHCRDHLTRWTGRTIPAWLSWAVIFVAALLVRHLLTVVLVAAANQGPGG